MSQSQVALSILASARGAVALLVLREAGVHPETLRRLVEAGQAERPASGHYALAGRIDVLDIDWVAFALQVPDGAIGLLTAAVHHEMTQELPSHLQAFVPRSRSGRLTLGGDSRGGRRCRGVEEPASSEQGHRHRRPVRHGRQSDVEGTDAGGPVC